MSSNGFLRSTCSDCLFYSSVQDYGHLCTFELRSSSDCVMKHISALDLDNDNGFLREKYYEICPLFISVTLLKDFYRSKFIIDGDLPHVGSD